MPQQKNIFGGTEPARLMAFDNTAPAGYAATPGTGPAGEMCGSCRHHATLKYSKRYHKCRLMQAQWTPGAATDIRVRSPACKQWEKKPDA